MAEKYNASNVPLEQILGDIKSGNIAIPEIQRPFVWKARQVRDLIDSLYTGYPTGYIIISQSPKMRRKDGTMSQGEKMMIDGQQRITALMTAIMGMEVVNANFEKKRIKISFNPLVSDDSEEERFKVQDNSTLRDKRWIADIAEVFTTKFDTWNFVNDYCRNNSEIAPNELSKRLMQLTDIKNRQIGQIVLNKDLSIDEVTEIFIRINSRGAKLNQADFAMSKIASNTLYGGDMLRKAIDYFSHLAVQPEWYIDMCKDTEFMNAEYADKLKWLKDDRESILDPDYNDILRISFMYKFGRAKMKDLVSLLGGRDFETREYKEVIAENTFKDLKDGVVDFMNHNRFSSFVKAIKGVGFRSSKLINSKITLDFAYTLYLLLHNDSKIDKSQIDRYVTKWYILSTLTSRYISSAETTMEFDLRRIAERGFETHFQELEAALLSETFWSIGLVQNLETSVINSPYFNIYLAAQLYNGDKALFTTNCRVEDLVTVIGDVHHIFPKQNLIKNGITDKSRYNQIANYTYLDPLINKLIKDAPTNVYFAKVIEQCSMREAQCGMGDVRYGNIYDIAVLRENLAQNSIPNGIENMTHIDYDSFLESRRVLMAQKIKEYYDRL